MFAQLGDIVFEGLKGFTGYRLKHAQTLAQHALIDGKPRLQKTGDALDELQVDMTFHRNFCSPEAEIAKLRTHVQAGSVLPLITGTGELVGNFTVSSMDITVNHCGPTGVMVFSTVSVSLLEAAEIDPQAAAVQAAKSVAFAVASNSPVVSSPIVSTGPGFKAVEQIQKSSSLQDAGNSSLIKAQVNPPTQTNELRKAKDAFKKIGAAMDTFKETVEAVEDSVDSIETILSTAENVQTYVNNTLDAIEALDLSSALSGSSDVRTGIDNLSASSSSIVAQTAARRI